MTQREKLAQTLLRPINPALIIILGIYTIVWGVWVGNPFWSVFGTADLFSVLANVAPEWFWGAVAVAAGTITVYGATKRHYKPLVRGAATAGWHWFMICIFYFLGDPLNTGGITALFLCVYAVAVYLNIRVNHKDSNQKQDLHL